MTLMIDRLDFKRFNRNAPADLAASEQLLSEDTPAFEITNVADLCYRMELFAVRDGDITLHPEKFPNVAPPFRSYWMEWRPPRFLDPERTIGRFGMWCVITDNTDDEHWSVMCCMFINERKPQAAGFFELRITRAGHVIDPGRLKVYPEAGDRIMGWHRSQRDDDVDISDIIDDYEQEAAGLSGTARDEYRRLKIAELEERKAIVEAEVGELKQRALDLVGDGLRIGVLPPLLLAHSLLGCKNVETEEHRPAGKLARAAVKRREKPLTTYKTLLIRPMGGRAEAEQRIALGNGHTALHLVRGHFKTFTAERPLFGTRVGTYWWSPNVRGSADEGVVVKDYKVQV